MKNIALAVICILIPFLSFAQINFKPGYYLTNTEQKVEGLIKDTDWRNNPDFFTFKSSPTENPTIIAISQTIEFGIDNSTKYIRKEVPIEQSSSDLNQLSDKRAAKFENAEVFLKVLVEGTANLYYYEGKALKRFFYSTTDSEVKPLVYKTYLTDSKNRKENNSYKQELWTHLKCKDLRERQVINMKYKKEDMIAYFEAYNECRGVEPTLYEQAQSEWKKLIHFSIRPGVEIQSLKADNEISDARDVTFDQKANIRFGLELEAILPFNRNKWAIFIEPTFQNYKASEELAFESVRVDYKSIKIPTGVRHYFYLNSESRIFINGAINWNLPFNSLIEYEGSGNLLIGGSTSYALGIGYKYEKFGIELRYQTNESILGRYQFWNADYSSTVFILGYTVF